MSNALTSDRCYGVDVLKTLSMFMVVVLHLVSGVMGTAEGHVLPYWTATALQVGTYCCVNCFGLATGYLMTGRKARYRKLLPMWLTVTFYCGIGLLLKKYVLHDTIYLTTLLQAVFPVSASVYWYFTAYFCLYLFMPFLNQLVEVMSRQQHRNLLVVGFILFCIPQVANVTRLHATDIVGLNEGYGMFWLMYLYFLGAGMKKHGFFLGMRSGKAVLGFVSMVLLTCLSKYGYEMLPEQLPGIVVSIVREYGSSRFISYLSPTIVAETEYQLRANLVEDGVGIAFSSVLGSRAVRNPAIKAVRVSYPPNPRIQTVFWRADQELSPAATRFRDFLVHFYQAPGNAIPQNQS